MAAHADISSEISSLRIEEHPLQKLEESLHVSLDKLKEFEGSCLSVVGNTKVSSPTSYWNTLGTCIQAVSKECTKLSMAFGKPPLPSKQATEALVEGFEVVVTAVLATFKAFNEQDGALLHSALKTYVIDLNKALLDFIKSINCQKKDEMLRTVGIVWECCENLASLPKDIKELAIKESKSCFELINDAITELEEYYQEWHESHCELVLNAKESMNSGFQEQHILASIGLAKVAKSLLKRITKCFNKNAQIDGISKVKELDTVTQTIQLLSPSVDDLFCSIYSDSVAECHSEGLELASLVEKLIQLCRSSHFCLDEDNSWLDFISQALDHNLNKLTTEQSI